MSAPAPNSVRARLGARLREHRKSTGLSGNQFAAHLGWQQTRISKLETGTQLPNQDDLNAWARATGISQAEANELHQLAAYAQDEHVTWREQHRNRGGTAAQHGLGAREQRSSLLREFWPSTMPDLLQTADYAREALSLPCGPIAWGMSPDDIEDLVAARIRRQDVLYSQDTQVCLVLGETALWTRFGPVETLLGQLDRLVAVSGLETVELDIIPLGTPLPAEPLSMITLYDTEAVLVQSLAGEHTVFDPDHIATYASVFAQLRDVAVTGADAVGVINHVASQLH